MCQLLCVAKYVNALAIAVNTASWRQKMLFFHTSQTIFWR
jgi:hypothetical protein